MRFLYLLSFALLLTGCELLGADGSESVYARTNQETYLTSEPVTYSLINESDDAVTFSACQTPTYRIERRTGRKWTPVHDSPDLCLAVYTMSIRLAPGETYRGDVSGFDSGTYRLSFSRLTESGGAAHYDSDEVLYTNPFTVNAAE